MIRLYYYYNDKWQVFAEFDGDDSIKRWYVYGNYIDEVLLSAGVGGSYYYLHDHLYSPVALISFFAGTVIERYEYDAYGNCNVLESDFTADADGISDCNNPYYFTGRRMDTLDNGSLETMYYRNRYYDTYSGRFLQHDPLSINPAGDKTNRFAILEQYRDGMCLYEYVKSQPIHNSDPFGLAECCKWYEKLLCQWEVIGYKPDLITCWASVGIYGPGEWPFFCWRIDEWTHWGCYFKGKECKLKPTFDDWIYLGIYIFYIYNDVGTIINFEPENFPPRGVGPPGMA